MKTLLGTGVALVTPFKEDTNIDAYALAEITNRIIEQGADYLVILGSTAETATLSENEKEQITQIVLETNKHRLPVVIGIGGNNTTGLTKTLEKLDSKPFESVLSAAPNYVRPSQEGLYMHYKTLDEHSPLPILMYNVPKRTGCDISSQTIARLAKDCKNIVGIKEASDDIVKIMDVIKNCPENFLVISGDDCAALPLVMTGGHGVISVIANSFPKEISTLIKLGMESKNKEAIAIQSTLWDAIGMIFEEGNPVGIYDP